jgi:hypothetical protein
MIGLWETVLIIVVVGLVALIALGLIIWLIRRQGK